MLNKSRSDEIRTKHSSHSAVESIASIDDNNRFMELRRKLLDKSARVGVIGLGYVGLPLSLTFLKGGFRVDGFEKDQSKAELINQGVSYVQDVATPDLQEFSNSGRLKATTDFTALGGCDVVIICVPTPLAKSQEPDMSFIISAIESIELNFKPGQLIVLESTTYPGTTREVLLSRLELASESRSGKVLECGKDFFLAFSPERVDPGNKSYSTYNTPKVVGGITRACTDLACLLYSQVLEKVVRVSSPESAEMVKLLENTFRAVNVGLVNEVAIMCEKLGIDCWEVIEAAATKPFGFMPFYPGPGLGGHCIPIDPAYLSWKLRTLNYTARFIELANTINTSMPMFCVEKIVAALNLDRKAVNGSKILVLGVAYKKDVDDLRESPAIDIIHLLQQRGAAVSYYDPFVSKIRYEGISLDSLNWQSDIGRDFDALVVATDHSKVDYAIVLQNSKRIIDTRNALKAFKDKKIVKI